MTLTRAALAGMVDHTLLNKLVEELFVVGQDARGPVEDPRLPADAENLRRRIPVWKKLRYFTNIF